METTNYKSNNSIQSFKIEGYTVLKKKSASNCGFEVKTAKQIQEQQLKKNHFIVPGLLSPGLNILAGPAKHGKSFMALDLALSIARGTEFWGRPVEQQECLYMALEDNDQRIQQRIDKILDYQDAPENLYFTYSANTISDGLMKDLDKFMESHPGVKLVIVDVIQMVRDDKKAGQSEYSSDYDDIGAFKSFADKHRISVLIITHTRKTDDKKVSIHKISGGVGIVGVADTILLLEPDGEYQATLEITSRDTGYEKLKIAMDPETCRWSCLGSELELSAKSEIEEYSSCEAIQCIKNLMEHKDSWSGTCDELLKYGLDMFGHEIAKSTSALARKISKFDELLCDVDGVEHIRPNPHGGTKGRIHTFRKMTNISEYGDLD